ncbi:MAG: S8 family serine peptidase, partial [Gammaproteobacteria bacterium]|nr:S8 family serine peptidase [Gammaproteobacteria bacterium]
MERKYFVLVHKADDLEKLEAELAESTGQGCVPSHACECTNKRPEYARGSDWMLTKEEAKTLRNDPRVSSVDRNDIKVQLHGEGTLTGYFGQEVNAGSDDEDFNKYGSEYLHQKHNDLTNWGLARHSKIKPEYTVEFTPASNDVNAVGAPLRAYSDYFKHRKHSSTYEYRADGEGVDIVIWDSGIDLDHPEFQDENGDSRIQKIDWYLKSGVTGTMLSDDAWYGQWHTSTRENADGYTVEKNTAHGTKCASIAAGKRHGWAKKAHIYFIPLDLGNGGTAEDILTGFSLIKGWHEGKTSGRPTVVSMSFGLPPYDEMFNAEEDNPYTHITYRGVEHDITDQTPEQIGMKYGLIPLKRKEIVDDDVLNHYTFYTASVHTGMDEMMDEVIDAKNGGIHVCVSAGNTGEVKADVRNAEDVESDEFGQAGKDFLNTVAYAGGYSYPYARLNSPYSPKAFVVGSMSGNALDGINGHLVDNANGGTLRYDYNGKSELTSRFSTRGAAVNIWAAGEGIASADATHDPEYVLETEADKHRNWRGYERKQVYNDPDTSPFLYFTNPIDNGDDTYSIDVKIDGSHSSTFLLADGTDQGEIYRLSYYIQVDNYDAYGVTFAHTGDGITYDAKNSSSYGTIVQSGKPTKYGQEITWTEHPWSSALDTSVSPTITRITYSGNAGHDPYEMFSFTETQHCAWVTIEDVTPIGIFNDSAQMIKGGATTWQGTSAATPQVAGVLAQYLEHYPTYSPAQLKEKVLELSTARVGFSLDEMRGTALYENWDEDGNRVHDGSFRTPIGENQDPTDFHYWDSGYYDVEDVHLQTNMGNRHILYSPFSQRAVDFKIKGGFHFHSGGYKKYSTLTIDTPEVTTPTGELTNKYVQDGAQHTVTLRLKGSTHGGTKEAIQNGTGIPVTFSVTEGTMSTTTDHGDGTYSATYTVGTPTEENQTITAYVFNKPVEDVLNLVVIPDAPEITSGTAVNVNENIGAGQAVYIPSANQSNVTYSLDSGQEYFEFNTAGDVVVLKPDPNYETNSSYSFSIKATNAYGETGEPVTVLITILDVDEVAPVFTNTIVSADVYENTGSQVAYIAVMQDDHAISVSLKQVDDYAKFSVGSVEVAGDVSYAHVTLLENPDYDTQATYNFTLVATDSLGNTSEQAVQINVIEVLVDQTAPVFTSGTTCTVLENTGANQVIYTAVVDDESAVSFSLVGADSNIYSIGAETGEVTLIVNPDYETYISNFPKTFTVRAMDFYGNSKDLEVTLTIIDVDYDDIEIITPDVIYLPSGLTVNTAIHWITTNVSSNYSLTYSRSGEDSRDIYIDETGEVTLLEDTDYSSMPANKKYYSVTFKVIATHNDTGEVITITQAVTFHVVDPNIQAPNITSGSTGDYTLAENTQHTQTLIYTVTSDSLDAVYDLSQTTGWTDELSIDSETGAVSFTGVVDYEADPTVVFHVGAYTPNRALYNTKSITVTVTDVDDEQPIITSSTFATTVIEESAANQEVYTATVLDDRATTFSLVDLYDYQDFSINSSTGVVTYTPVPTYEKNGMVKTFKVKATDDLNGNDATIIVGMVITPIHPELTWDSTDTITVNENIPANTVIYTPDVSGTSPYTFTKLGGSEELELTSTSTGAMKITVSPDYEDRTSYAIEYKVTDDKNREISSKEVNVLINDIQENQPIISVPSTINVDEGTSQSTVIATATCSNQNNVIWQLGGQHFSLFSIDIDSGEITCGNQGFSNGQNFISDYETQSTFFIKVRAYNSDQTGVSDWEDVDIIINNVDEYDPV